MEGWRAGKVTDQSCHRMSADSAINSLEDMNDFLFRFSRLAASLWGEAGLETNQCRLWYRWQWPFNGLSRDGCPFRTLPIDSELHIHLLTGPLLIHTSALLLLKCSSGLTWSILTQPAVNFSLVYFYCKYGTQSSASASASCVITFY